MGGATSSPPSCGVWVGVDVARAGHVVLCEKAVGLEIRGSARLRGRAAG